MKHDYFYYRWKLEKVVWLLCVTYLLESGWRFYQVIVRRRKRWKRIKFHHFFVIYFYISTSILQHISTMLNKTVNYLLLTVHVNNKYYHNLNDSFWRVYFLNTIQLHCYMTLAKNQNGLDIIQYRTCPHWMRLLRLVEGVFYIRRLLCHIEWEFCVVTKKGGLLSPPYVTVIKGWKIKWKRGLLQLQKMWS